MCVDIERPIFRWVYRLSSVSKVPREGDLVLSPTVVAVRDFIGDWSVSSAVDTKQTCFVDYSSGCGNFRAEDWINKNQHPFHKATLKFGTSRLTVNELAVLKLWENCESLYRAAGA